ncbi:hypothetical protein ACFV6F_09295, partial [Kitasatospora phosalacinea]|uniref:hypothetical protein n=1 Tax=Kitasatospora phosalacinea TaxID=2065 RepID=UPI00364FC502
MEAGPVDGLFAPSVSTTGRTRHRYPDRRTGSAPADAADGHAADGHVPGESLAVHGGRPGAR